MANPFPFSVGAVLTASQMNGIGEVQTYTPSFPANFSLGNGSVSGRYVRVQKLVYVVITIGVGSTTAMTGVSPSVSLPVTAVSSPNTPIGQVWWFDNSAGAQTFGPVSNGGTTSVAFNIYSASGPNVGINYAAPGAPFTLAINDAIYMSFVYEAA